VFPDSAHVDEVSKTRKEVVTEMILIYFKDVISKKSIVKESLFWRDVQTF
jgi:hypothetical protein